MSLRGRGQPKLGPDRLCRAVVTIQPLPVVRERVATQCVRRGLVARTKITCGSGSGRRVLGKPHLAGGCGLKSQLSPQGLGRPVKAIQPGSRIADRGAVKHAGKDIVTAPRQERLSRQGQQHCPQHPVAQQFFARRSRHHRLTAIATGMATAGAMSTLIFPNVPILPLCFLRFR